MDSVKENYEIIFMNDGSSDGTRDKLEESLMKVKLDLII